MFKIQKTFSTLVVEDKITIYSKKYHTNNLLELLKNVDENNEKEFDIVIESW